MKLWQKIEDLLKVQYDKQQASRQKKLEERAREDREPDARDKMVASIEKSLADVNEKQAKAKAKIEIGFWKRVAKFLGRIRSLVKGASWATIEPLPEDVILRARDLSMHFGGLKAVEALDFDYLITGHSIKPEPKAAIYDYIDVAENIDFEGGIIQKESAFTPGVVYKQCFSKTKPKGKKSAFVMISEDKL